MGVAVVREAPKPEGSEMSKIDDPLEPACRADGDENGPSSAVVLVFALHGRAARRCFSRFRGPALDRVVIPLFEAPRPADGRLRLVETPPPR